MPTPLIGYVLVIAISCVIAFFARNKRIGSFWVLFFGLTLSPLISAVFTILSYPKNTVATNKGDKYNPILGVIFALFPISYLFNLLQTGDIIGSIVNSQSYFYAFLFAAGCVGLSIYFFRRTERNNTINKENADQELKNSTNT